MIPPGGLYALTVAVWAAVLGLTVLNAWREEWGLVINGAILTAALLGVVVSLRPPPKA